MCGIFGELRFDGGTPDKGAILQATQALSSRGPDNAGFYQDGPVALAHRRLAIIDLSERARQPMIDAALGLTLVFNGAIYNYPELRADLIARGHRFFSHGDSEVILKAYAEWGIQCPQHLHGMFAFAIWDRKTKHLFLARDRLGIKPLYFTKTARCLRFSSNTAALLAMGDVDTRVDPIALHHHLTLHGVVPAPRTILQGIRKLEPATAMTLGPDGAQSHHTYWQLAPYRIQGDIENGLDEQKWIEAIDHQLRQAVERRLKIADVPVGVLLSGGLDSSLLVALMAESGISDIRTFSVGFEDAPEEAGSEFLYSDAVAEYYGTHHQKYTIPNQEVLARLPEAIGHMSEPMVAQDAVAFYLLAEQVATHIKVVQSGQGADEVFGGYFWYPLMQRARGTDLERFRPYYFDRDHAEFLQTVLPSYGGDDHTSRLIAKRLATSNAGPFPDRVLDMDVTMLIVDDPVKRVDNMTMAFGLEARVPFLDHQVVELAAQMPARWKLKDNGKYPLKRIARGRLPDSVIDRPKGYFPLPALKHIRGDFLDLIRDALTSETCRQRGLFRPEYLDRLLAEPDRHMTPIRGNKLWHAALLELWLQINIRG
uniref:asparagine synthase (glutamine-hydrolyzing) n=1 Tax=Candidatus Kentrum sp. MB TaxID=2138164 RepID=A0A450X900_9GAMM|nr:MAG: asparagine synthase (glutamine-hydrolysing) [Candidatus Kentron sp. MB]